MGNRSWYAVLLVLFSLLRMTTGQQQPQWGSTCGSIDTAYTLFPNVPLEETNLVGVLGVGEQACFKIKIAEEKNDMVVAVTSENWNLNLDIMSPKDSGINGFANSITTQNVLSGDQQASPLEDGLRNYRMWIKNPQDGWWQFTVSNLDPRRLAVFSLVVYVDNQDAPDLHEDDFAVVNRIFGFCCQNNDGCELWRKLGGPKKGSCKIPGWKCTKEGHLLDMVLIGDAGGLGLECTFKNEEFSQLKYLQRLQLRWQTQLSGTVNFTMLAAGLPDLQHLDLAFTDIQGNVSCDKLSSLPKLTTLDLSSRIEGNKFGGPFPRCYLQKRDMQILRLSRNEFTGNLFGGDYTTFSQVRWLSVSDNLLSGNIPGPSSGGQSAFGFGTLQHLEVLQLSGNQLTGNIPSSLNQPSLLVVDFSNNGLSGGIPSTIMGRQNLRSLNLANNQLSGSIPNELVLMSNLSEIIFSNNRLTGPLPTDWSGMVNLRWLDVGNNNISGSIPATVLGLPNLIALDLSHNTISGNIPELPFKGDGSRSIPTNLKFLKLSNNQLTGPLPESFADLPGFSFQPQLDANNVPLTFGYDFAFNKLSGYLPAFVFHHTNTNVTFAENEDMQCPSVYGNGLGITCVSANYLLTASPSSSSVSGGALAGIVIAAVAVLALGGILIGLIMYRRRHNRARAAGAPATTQGQDAESMMQDDSSTVAQAKKLWRTISNREPTYVKFAGDVESSWSFRK